MKYFIQVLKKYAVFTGRATRSEYWYFTLIAALIGLGLSLADHYLFKVPILDEADLGPLFKIYFLLILLPSVAVSVRRLHDTNKSGWLVLLNFIPLVSIVLLVFLATNGDANENKYGPNPKLLKIG